MSLRFPPIFLLRSHFEKDPQELHRLEKEIGVVWDIREAKVVLGKINTKTRAKFELRKLGWHAIQTESSDEEAEHESQKSPVARKRRKLNSSIDKGREIIALDSGSETQSDLEGDIDGQMQRKTLPLPEKFLPPVDRKPPTPKSSAPHPGTSHTISILRLSWYTDSLNSGELLPYEKYLVYQGEIVPKPKSQPTHTVTKTPSKGNALARAREDTPSPSKRSFGKHASQAHRAHHGQSSSQRANLLHESTEEPEGTAMPPIPEYLNTTFSCQRPTPLHCPNEAFLAQLRIIKKARALDHDIIGIRAYSAAVATIASYPYTLTSARELSRLPNCGPKMATLWREWRESGRIAEVEEIEADKRMQVLNIFYDIHDVAEGNAKKFYDRGWKDLDDVVEQGWNTLTRNQQIGVKFYDEFKLKISRAEVESTANVIFSYANQLREGFQMVICGGYRRGKPDCGDVDVVLSHPDEEATNKFLEDLLSSLEEHCWITHRLTYSTRNSERGQSPVSWKGGMRKAGPGFDTLDHAFVVWQNPKWPSQAEDLKNDPDFVNPNPHRRVDIIVAPWKTAGCAVVGWSGGTMFERDLRKYCKDKLNLKFDSSGVRRREDGSWVDLEAGNGDLLVKEKRVFAGLGLQWREPTERCTD